MEEVDKSLKIKCIMKVITAMAYLMGMEDSSMIRGSIMMENEITMLNMEKEC